MARPDLQPDLARRITVPVPAETVVVVVVRIPGVRVVVEVAEAERAITVRVIPPRIDVVIVVVDPRPPVVDPGPATVPSIVPSVVVTLRHGPAWHRDTGRDGTGRS